MDGLPVLVRPEQEFLIGDATAYAAAWKRTKWAVRREAILELPYGRWPGWKQKAQSFRELLALLGPTHERKVVEVGFGTGWLSQRLGAAWVCFFDDVIFPRF